MRLIDTHTHLDQFGDVAGVLTAAEKEGVEAVIACSVDLDSSVKTLNIKKTYSNFNIFIALGLHPYEPDEATLDDFFGLLNKNIKDLAAVGEIGLDYWYKEAREAGPGRDLQQELYKRQLKIAKEHDKPAIVHSRGAWQDAFSLAKEQGLKKVLFHWYTGPEDILRDILDEGYYISVTPSCGYSKEAQRALDFTPLDRLMLETDSPVKYRPPEGVFMAEPKDIISVAEIVSWHKGVSPDKVAEVTTENANKFFELNLGL